MQELRIGSFVLCSARLESELNMVRVCQVLDHLHEGEHAGSARDATHVHEAVRCGGKGCQLICSILKAGNCS